MEFLRGAVEILILATATYLMLRFLRETRGTGVVRGLTLFFIFLAVFALVIVPLLSLDRVRFVFQELLPTAVLGLVIIFQPEIRQAIIRLGETPIFRPLTRGVESRVIPRILRAVARLSAEKFGALIVIQKDTPLKQVVERGIRLDADINSFLLESIFYPGNPLHDGAVVVEGDRILAASCLLPLSDNQEISKRLGSRHRAALGISEQSDAVAIVVSEETGRVSVATGGKLIQDLKLAELETFLEGAYGAREGQA